MSKHVEDMATALAVASEMRKAQKTHAALRDMQTMLTRDKLEEAFDKMLAALLGDKK